MSNPQSVLGELATTDDFQRVVVEFNSQTLAVESISADRKEFPDPNDTTNFNWDPVGSINPHRENSIEIPGVYNVNSAIFSHCVRLIANGSIELFYSFNDRVEIAAADILADPIKQRTYRSFLSRDPFQAELAYRALQNVPVMIENTVPSDKVFFKYGDPEFPAVTLPTVSGVKLKNIFTAMKSIGWYATAAEARANEVDTNKTTLHLYLVTYSVSNDKRHYILEGRRLDDPVDVPFKIRLPVTRKES